MTKILVIEDDDNVRELYGLLLETKGYSVLSAASGREGLALYDPDEIDLVLTDIFMDDMDGYEVIDTLRHAFYDVKIIAVTGAGFIDAHCALEMAKSRGAQAALTKPINWKVMNETIRAVLNGAKPLPLG